MARLSVSRWLREMLEATESSMLSFQKEPASCHRYISIMRFLF